MTGITIGRRLRPWLSRVVTTVTALLALGALAGMVTGCDAGPAPGETTGATTESTAGSTSGPTADGLTSPAEPSALPTGEPTADPSAGASSVNGSSTGGYAGPTRPKGKLDQGWVVVDVVDGDTIKVLKRGRTETIRLIGIDTPETVAPGQPVECFGPQSSAAMNSIALGRRVSLEEDLSQDRIDRYGRRLAFIWIEDQRGRPAKLVQWMMVKRGYASEYTYDEPHAWVDELQGAQRAAQRAGRGLWPVCPAGTTRGG